MNSIFFLICLIAVCLGDSVMLSNTANSTLTTSATPLTYAPILALGASVPVKGSLIQLALPSGNVTYNAKLRVYAEAQACYTSASVGYTYLAITQNGNIVNNAVVSSNSQGPICLHVIGLFDLAFNGAGGAADVIAPEMASSTVSEVFTIYSSNFVVFTAAF